MNTLRFIALSHKYVSTEERSAFSMDKDISNQFSKILVAKYPDIKGLLILNTCNRVEMYIESKVTLASEVFGVLASFLNTTPPSGVVFSDDTFKSSKRLLEVASGLDSSLIGDKQIFSQIKTAFLNSLAINMQGSLLERTFQSVNQLHKKIINTTQFYTNTNSYGYLSLKVAKEFSLQTGSKNKILLLGAGEMIREVASYTNKFDFNKIVIANRTLNRAEDLANKYKLDVIDYQYALSSLDEYDVVITAVSHQKHIIDPSIVSQHRKQLFIDLGLPSNVTSNVTENRLKTLLDLQYFNTVFNKNKTLAMNDREKVTTLMNFHHNQFIEWHSQYSSRLTSII
ncbi:MAG: NAD(P)-binding domain-containing protein [Bacteroidia bacterium]|nr:NAD(P)-binding domain-containing protein [Bacteroidia bacterium]